MKIHMIGIGGIGMSALARYYLGEGHVVTGTNNEGSELIESLRSEGINVTTGDHDEKNLNDDTELVVYTIAITSDNPELLKSHKLANENKCRVLTYPEALGEMCKIKKVIAVCGTHGKTTTTAMTFTALNNAGVNVSMILGSLIEHDGKMTNYIKGDSEWLVIEACEYKRSFLSYYPHIVLVTNIDNDHLDYYKDLDDIKSAFQEFVNQIQDGGTLIVHANEEFLNVKNTITKINADQIEISQLNLKVPGLHNRMNARLVIALQSVMQIDRTKLIEGLEQFNGTWRRQEFKGEYLEMQFFDDYAHHPTEIKATLQAFREKFPEKKITVVFMPHLYSRTKILFDEFTKCFDDANEVLVLPIYAAREKFDVNVTSDALAIEISKFNPKLNVVSFKNIETLVDYLRIHNSNDKVVITMGAGDIYKVYDLLK